MKTNKKDNQVFENLDNLLVKLSTVEEASLTGGRRGRGQDDGPGHVRHGNDDGPNHD